MNPTDNVDTNRIINIIHDIINCKAFCTELASISVLVWKSKECESLPTRLSIATHKGNTFPVKGTCLPFLIFDAFSTTSFKTYSTAKASSEMHVHTSYLFVHQWVDTPIYNDTN